MDREGRMEKENKTLGTERRDNIEALYTLYKKYYYYLKYDT